MEEEEGFRFRRVATSELSRVREKFLYTTAYLLVSELDHKGKVFGHVQGLPIFLIMKSKLKVHINICSKGNIVDIPGATWRYRYYGNGMMKLALSPDGERITFKYDSLGRRIEKRSNSKIMKFVWDGNNPIHEWSEQPDEIEKYIKAPKHDFTTWVFEDGFTPSAKLTRQGNYSIISDYLGTPVEAYDSNGNKVWEVELDIYGRIRKKPFDNTPAWARAKDYIEPFDDNFIPFRYQGQYHDEEIDLYYNRFRYYSPELGQYMTQDPIGLAGGNPTLYGYVGDPNAWIDPFG